MARAASASSRPAQRTITSSPEPASSAMSPMRSDAETVASAKEIVALHEKSAATLASATQVRACSPLGSATLQESSNMAGVTTG